MSRPAPRPQKPVSQLHPLDLSSTGLRERQLSAATNLRLTSALPVLVLDVVGLTLLLLLLTAMFRSLLVPLKADRIES
jgi:hypothetical protein